MGQENNQEVINEFSKRRKRQLLATIPLVLAVIGMVSVEDMNGSLAGIPVSVISSICIGVVFAGVIFSLFNWKCPACSAYLGKGFSPKFCRKCGSQLQ